MEHITVGTKLENKEGTIATVIGIEFHRDLRNDIVTNVQLEYSTPHPDENVNAKDIVFFIENGEWSVV